MGEGAEALEEVAVALEIGAEHFGDGQDVVAVGHGGQDVVEDEAGGGLDVFLVAGGTEPAAFAGEGEEVFVAAVVAADAGEAAVEVAAVEDLWTTWSTTGRRGRAECRRTNYEWRIGDRFAARARPFGVRHSAFVFCQWR